MNRIERVKSDMEQEIAAKEIKFGQRRERGLRKAGVHDCDGNRNDNDGGDMVDRDGDGDETSQGGDETQKEMEDNVRGNSSMRSTIEGNNECTADVCRQNGHHAFTSSDTECGFGKVSGCNNDTYVLHSCTETMGCPGKVHHLCISHLTAYEGKYPCHECWLKLEGVETSSSIETPSTAQPPLVVASSSVTACIDVANPNKRKAIGGPPQEEKVRKHNRAMGKVMALAAMGKVMALAPPCIDKGPY